MNCKRVEVIDFKFDVIDIELLTYM